MELSPQDLDLLRAWTRGDYLYQRERPPRLHQLYERLAEPAPTLFRGEQHDAHESDQDWSFGAKVERVLASASEDPTQAEVFAYDVLTPFDRPLHVMMEMRGARGVPVDKYLGEHEFGAQREWLISGTYRIVDVFKEYKDTLHVVLEPVRQARTAIAEQVWYRATNDIWPLMEADTFVHLGTWQAATQARDLPSAMGGMEPAYKLYRVDIEPKNPLPAVVHDDVANAIAVLDTYRRTGEWAPWWGERHSDEEYVVQWLLNTGRRYPQWRIDPDTIHQLDAVYYINDYEDAGSTSVMVRPSAVGNVTQVAYWDDELDDWVPFEREVGDETRESAHRWQNPHLVTNPYFDPERAVKYREAEQALREFEQLLWDEYRIVGYELEEWWPQHRIPLSDIIPTQDWLDPRKFEIGEEGLSPGGPGDAMVIKYQGEHFLIDGHHRYKKFLEAGEDDMMVRVIDMDADPGRTAYWAASWCGENLPEGVFVGR